ncbi:hypothetical protein [Streptomyces sp. NPDC127033]|uniref:hypothetical protein n=1 Tax=Streptomyces sp. NPDC127033 TaxID=3347110 RepID=UPI00364865A4
MLPTEPPLSLHRLVAPTPPARVQDSGAAATALAPRTPVVVVPAAMSNAAMAQSAQAKPPVQGAPMPGAAQDQTGNAAVAHAALHAAPVALAQALPLAVIVPPKPGVPPGK